jgi:hypothetical protein
MIATLVSAAFLLGQTPSALDHSGEAMLKEIFAKSGEFRNARLLVTKAGRTAGGIYLQDSTLDIWLGSANHIRMESMSTMGDSTLTVSDGIVTMVDPLSDDDPVRLTKATPKLDELNPREPLLYFLAGPPAYERLVDADKAITLLPSGDAVEFRSKTLGKVIVGRSSSGLPSKIELFQSSRRRDAGAESEFAILIETIQPFGPAPAWPGRFSVTPPKGRKVQDDRAKPVSST